jgi:hypothetical protein
LSCCASSRRPETPRPWRRAGLAATALAVLLALPGCEQDGQGTTQPTVTTPGGQTLSATDLVILGEGNDAEIRAAVRRHGGTVVQVVEQTDTYTARFPADSYEELRAIRDRLRDDGLNAALVPTIDLGKYPS